MPKINLLPTSISELIAAGEVVERPASVIKEMVENSIDAGATHITVEIQRGGILYMRITDDGCGISKDDVPLAFLRHATSKISTGSDLDFIKTLGFRGEALAATAAVSKIEMFTRSRDESIGSHYCIEGGKETLFEESGCPDGTTIIVRDLFYNTPARMKFLKKDVSEGNAVSALIERLALSHPEISFKLIREGKTVLSTVGDGKLESVIYSVLGRDFSKTLIPLQNENNAVTVNGFICKPVFCRQSRAGQYIFLNNRLIHSGTITAAVEQAYKNSAMVGKFPAFVINVNVPFDTVDVNVHPAKTEIRFSDEKRIFDTVYYAVKNALTLGDTRPTINVSVQKQAVMPNFNTNFKEYKQEKITDITPERTVLKTDTYSKPKIDINIVKEQPKVTTHNSAPSRMHDFGSTMLITKKETPKPEDLPTENVVRENVDTPIEKENNIQEELEIRLIGEAFLTYIVVECKNSIYLIDKHAAHERILFNELKNKLVVDVQTLLAPIQVKLGEKEYDAVLDNTELLLKSGFEIEDFGNNTVIVRAIPSTLLKEDVASVVVEAAAALSQKSNLEIEAFDRLYHTVACKAAIKAGNITNNLELLNLAKRVLNDRDVMYCPHGRPVAFELKKSDLEKQFGRIQ
ncbi:MAG: DNA mismatch repair endonuclease MutL [Oscillospiraceae bacterium]|nr:DNA mismatch repair endonuclease MutL [Oscillospiraceae bacterium]